MKRLLISLCFASSLSLNAANVTVEKVSGTNALTGNLVVPSGKSIVFSSGSSLSVPSGSFAPSAGSIAWTALTGQPTTMAGYGIVDGVTTAYVSAGYQPLASSLTYLAASAPTNYGRALLALADASAGRTAFGLGSLATQSGTFSGSSSGANTGDQSISITGDVTASGSTGALSATVTKLNGTALGGLATGLLKNTNVTGIPTIAISGTDYLTPSGSGASLTALNATQLTSGTVPAARLYTTLAGYGITDPIVLTSGSYADPAWITSLAATKLTGTLSAARLPAFTGDATSTVGTSALTLATVSAGGVAGSGSLVPVVTFNTKGLVTGITTATVTPAWGDITAKPTTTAGFGITNGANIDLWGAKGLPVGEVVGLTDTQALTGKTINGLTPTAQTNGFTIAGGTASKTLTVPLDATVSGTNTGDQTTVSGNAGSATILATARSINGVSFDGSANITVPSAASTLTGSTLAAGVTGSSLVSVGTLTTLSTSGVITSTVSTGTAPLSIASATNIPNLNASTINGATFAAPGPIGATTPSTGAFTTLSTSAVYTNTNTSGGASIVAQNTSVNGAAISVKSTDTGGRDWFVLSNGSGSGVAGSLSLYDAAANIRTLTAYTDGHVTIANGLAVTGTASASSTLTAPTIAATSSLGYATGAGGAVTQLTSKSTGVTLNKASGQITTHTSSLATGAQASFILTNSTIAATDVVHVSVASGGTVGEYIVTVDATASGSCTITLWHAKSGGILSEALVLNFVVIKAVNS